MLHPTPHRHSRFRRSRVLIVGCGDVGLRAARCLLPRCRVLALTSSPERVATAGLEVRAEVWTMSSIWVTKEEVLATPPDPGTGKAGGA